MAKLKIVLLVLVLLLGFILRLYKFNGPIADWHSWRQSDTSSVSRSFVKDGFDILHPRFHDLSSTPTGRDNPQGYRFVEFPIYNILQAASFEAFGIFSLEEWGRLVTIFSSTLSSLFIYLIVKKRAGFTAGIFSAAFFSLLPYSIYYGRIILPDPSMSASILGGIYFFDKWIENPSLRRVSLIFFAGSLILTAVALLLKPFAIFFTIPMIYLAVKKFGRKSFKSPYLWVFVVLTLLPLVLWRVWMTQFPEGIPHNTWLFNEGNIRFKGSFFYWIFADRVGRLILGYWGIAIFIFGFFAKFKKEDFLFFLSFILSSLLYLFVVARGNVQHDYYQILILPTVAIFMGLGTNFLLRSARDFSSKYVGPGVFIVSFVFCLMFSWYFIRDYYNINNPAIIKVGQEANRVIPEGSKVIAPYGGDTSFLYQTKRSGWPVFDRSLPELIDAGAGYLILLNPTIGELKDFGIYETISEGSDFVIFKLVQ